jgi:hypothetical protein
LSWASVAHSVLTSALRGCRPKQLSLPINWIRHQTSTDALSLTSDFARRTLRPVCEPGIVHRTVHLALWFMYCHSINFCCILLVYSHMIDHQQTVMTKRQHLHISPTRKRGLVASLLDTCYGFGNISVGQECPAHSSSHHQKCSVDPFELVRKPERRDLTICAIVYHQWNPLPPPLLRTLNYS